MTSPSRREGFALVLCFLLAIALSLMIAGMLVVMTRELQVASAATRLTGARATAESAARGAFAAWSTRSVRDIPKGAERLLRVDPTVTVRVRRLDSALFLVRADARVSGPVGPPSLGRAGLLVRTIGPGHLRSPEAAVVVEGSALLGEGTISGRDACADTVIAGLASGALQLEAGAGLDGDPPARTGDVDADPLESLVLGDLASVALHDGAGSPRPAVRGGSCEPGDWNWGAADPRHPCGDRRPLIHTAGDLVVRGGEGQGVLVVDGDLTLSGGFSFLGAILVGGLLRVEEATVRGRVRAGSLDIRGGTLQYSSCSVRAALESRPFDQAFRPPGRWWVPVF